MSEQKPPERIYISSEAEHGNLVNQFWSDEFDIDVYNIEYRLAPQWVSIEDDTPKVKLFYEASGQRGKVESYISEQVAIYSKKICNKETPWVAGKLTMDIEYNENGETVSKTIWWMALEENGNKEYEIEHVTHWMPLPAPPESPGA